jgi:hypothetical protein
VQRRHKIKNCIIGELVIGELAFTPCCYQPSAPQVLQML